MVKKRKKVVRYSKKLAREIADSVSEGIDVANLCRQNGNKYPDSKTICRWSNKHSEFKAMMDEAYFSYFMVLTSEFNSLRKMTASERHPDLPFREAAEAIKRETDNLKFLLSKAVPMLTRRFDKTAKVEHSGELAPTIHIMSYAKTSLPNVETAKILEETDKGIGLIEGLPNELNEE